MHLDPHVISDVIGNGCIIGAVFLDHWLSARDRERQAKEQQKTAAEVKTALATHTALVDEKLAAIASTATNNNKGIAVVKAIVETKNPTGTYEIVRSTNPESVGGV